VSTELDHQAAGGRAARSGLDSESIRKFVAVAEELHFGRAARRLGIAQPPLSRAIQQLERRLGVMLLERSGRTVALTEAGAVLPESGRAQLGRDLAAVPVSDAPPVTTVLAWPPHSRSRAVAGLVRAATGL
jgi:hypothetical protein